MSNNLTKLKRLMKRHKKNCREIAELIGYQHNTVRKWHVGLRPIPDRALQHLSLVLDAGRS